MLPQRFEREKRLGLRIGVAPFAKQQIVGVGGIDQRVVLCVDLSLLDRPDLLTDLDHGIAEAVELAFRFAFGRLDHQRARHRKRHGRGVKAEIHKPLGDVLHRNAGGLLDGAQVDDALMRHPAVLRFVEHGVMGREAVGHIVGGQNRMLGRPLEAFGAHHGDVGPGDGQNRRRAPGGGRDLADGARAAGCGVDALNHDMIGQEGREMGLDGDGPHPRPATAMGNAERLVQVDMADVGAEVGRPRMPDEGIEVGTVEIDLAAGAMDDVANLDNRRLEDAMGRGVRDHEGGEALGVLFGKRLECGDIDVAIVIARHHHHLEPGEHGAGRIGAMGRSGDEADVALAFAARLVIGANTQEPRVFALAAGIGLERDGIKARDLAKPRLELLKELQIALRLLKGRKGVHMGELAP